jgi:hypothetical protein
MVRKTLILVGQKGRGQTHEQHGHPHDDQQVDHQITACSTQNTADAVGIVVDALVKAGVKPAEKSFFSWCSAEAGFNNVAQSAGVSTSATSTESAMAETMVIEN